MDTPNAMCMNVYLQFSFVNCKYSDWFAGRWKSVTVKPKQVSAQRVLRSQRLVELRKMITENCIAAVKLTEDSRNKTLSVQNVSLVRVKGSVTKVTKRFLANAQVFEKDADHRLIQFFKKVGTKYLLGHDDYYCHLEYFVLTPEPLVVNIVTLVETERSPATP